MVNKYLKSSENLKFGKWASKIPILVNHHQPTQYDVILTLEFDASSFNFQLLYKT